MGPNTKTVVLAKPTDWEAWIFIVRSLAEGESIWELINLDLETEPVILTEPAFPTPTDINPATTSIIELTPDERELYKLLMAQYKEQSAKSVRTLDALNSLRKHIITTIAAYNHIYIMGQSTIYQILYKLKKRLAPTDYAREMEVVGRYNRVKSFSKRENVGKWLKEWEVVYKTASDLKIPEVDGKRVLFDFTHASQNTTWEGRGSLGPPPTHKPPILIGIGSRRKLSAPACRPTTLDPERAWCRSWLLFNTSASV